MRSVTQRTPLFITFLTLSVALSFASLSGCMYSPYAGGYGGGYGYGGGMYQQPGVYPGAYPQYGAPQYGTPIQTLTPGQQYVPGQVYPQGTIQPGGTPTYNNGSGGLQPIPDSNAPGFNSSGGGSVKTPDPYFPSSTSLSPVNDGVTPVTHNEMNQFDQQQGGLQPIPQGNPMAGAYAEPEATPTFGAQAEPSGMEFQPPVSGQNPFDAPAAAATPEPQPAPDQAMPVFNFEKPAADELNPFGHEPTYKWLRGVVSQDPNTGSWSIVYNDNPTEDDQLAGHITLAQSPYLEQLADGEVVEIQGEVDNIAKDAAGKPVYLIRSVTQLAKAPGQ